MQYATEKPVDPVELRVYRGADGQFTLYEDESDNYDYEKGMRATITFEWNDARQTLTIGKRNGKFPGMLNERTFHVVFVSPGHGGMNSGNTIGCRGPLHREGNYCGRQGARKFPVKQ